MQKIIMQNLATESIGICYTLPECGEDADLAHDAFARHRRHHAALAEAGLYASPFRLILCDSQGRSLITETITPAPIPAPL